MKKRYYLSIAVTIILLFITHKIWILTGNGPIFNGYPFLIILICGYLLSLKLTSYLADFKNIQNQSRIEIVFLTVFFIMLFIPMSHINRDYISQKENRTLTQWKPFIEDSGNLNYTFGKDFENWFNDRFYLKSILYELNALTSLCDSHWETPRVLKGEEDWLFYKGDNSIRNYQNLDPFTKEELEKITRYLLSVDNYCKKRNKQFYFVIAPDKNKIYGEHYPNYILKQTPNTDSRANQLTNYISDNTNIKVLYLYDTLKEHKKENQLYYKTDTHWNHLGAYYGYNEIINTINKDFNNNLPKAEINSVSYKEFSGDLNKMLPKYLQAQKEFEPITNIRNINHICKKTKTVKDIQYCTNINNQYNLIMYRDSFTVNLIPYLSESFKNSKYIWKYDVDKDEISDKDIVIIETVERYLPSFIRRKPLEEI